MGRSRSTPLSIQPAAKPSVTILVVDDERTLRESCASVLGVEGYKVTVAGCGEDALQLIKRRAFDIALIDWYMNQVSGLDLLRAILDTHSNTIVIAMTGRPSLESSLEALRAGVRDYLPKPFSGTHLQIIVARAAHAILAARESRAEQSDKLTVLGAAPLFCQAVDLARRVATTNASVFITGESGAGKELFAQFIHYHSRRASRPLIAVNCAALPEPLLESEMFGHVKGAFTGAVRDKPGLLEAANGGTLFLDELIEMSTPIQAKLLRVIQDGVVRRVGSETTDAVVSVRIIAATNREPEAAVKAGILRPDLYYRLRVVPIHVPALRERPEDIPLLANHFLEYYWRRHRDGGHPLPKFTKEALAALRAHAWPGNVRELQNVIEHTVVLLKPGADVQAQDIPFLTDDSTLPELSSTTGKLSEDGYYPARDHLLEVFDRRYLARLVVLAGGNLSRAARIARVDRTTLYRLMERYGLHRTSLVPCDHEA